MSPPPKTKRERQFRAGARKRTIQSRLEARAASGTIGFPPCAKPKKRGAKARFFPKKSRRDAPHPPYPAHRTPHTAAFCCILLHTTPTSLHTAAHRSTPPCSAKSLRRAPAEAGKIRKKTGGGEKKRKKRKRKKRRRMKRRGVPQTPLRFCEIKFPEMPPPPIPPGK